MKLSKQEAQEAIYGDSEDWKRMTLRSITDTSRWSIYYTQILRHVPTGKLYEFNWSSGATEQQDESPFEYQDTYEPIEVVATEKLVTVYEPVKEPPK